MSGRHSTDAAEYRLWRGDGRFQPGDVTDARRPAVSLILLFVDFQNLTKIEEQRLHVLLCSTSVGKFLERLSVSLVRPLLPCIDLFSPDGGFRWSDNRTFAVCADLEGCFGIDLEEFQNGAIDH